MSNRRTATPGPIGLAAEPDAVRLFADAYSVNGGNAAAAYRASHPRCRSENAAAVGALYGGHESECMLTREASSGEFRVAPRRDGCNKQDYAVLIVMGVTAENADSKK